MKRYWKFSTLVLFTLVTIAGFYFKTGVEHAKGYPLSFIDTSGDPNVLNHLTIHGDFTVFNSYVQRTFQLQGDTTAYENDLSYLDQLDNVFYQTPRIKNYVDTYKSFMRGKSQHPELFSEDETYISYVNDERIYSGQSSTQTLVINRLNKNTKKEEAYTFPLPHTEIDTHYYVEESFYKDEQVHILLQRTDYTGETYQDMYTLFVWDFETKQMTLNNYPLVFLPDEPYTHIQFIQASPSETNLTYAAFLVNGGDEVDDFGNLKTNASSQLFVFDYETRDLTQIENPTDTPLSIQFDGQRNTDHVYMFVNQIDSPLLEVDLSQSSPTLSQLIKGVLPVEEIEEGGVDSSSMEFSETDFFDWAITEYTGQTITRIHDGNMYVLDSIQNQKHAATLVVTDIQTGKELYTGSLELNSGEPLPMEYELFFHLLSFEQ